MSQAMTASQKPFFGALRRMGDILVGRGNTGWTTSKSEHPCLHQNCSQGSPAEKTGRKSLLNHPHAPLPTPPPIGQRTEHTVPRVIWDPEVVRASLSVKDALFTHLMPGVNYLGAWYPPWATTFLHHAAETKLS